VQKLDILDPSREWPVKSALHPADWKRHIVDKIVDRIKAFTEKKKETWRIYEEKQKKSKDGERPVRDLDIEG
jgi:hypothetical protein